MIALAVKYDGEYHMIIKHSEEKIAPLSLDALVIGDPEYPRQLLDLKCPPLVLFYKGDLSLLKEKAIAIVGSRQPC